MKGSGQIGHLGVNVVRHVPEETRLEAGHVPIQDPGMVVNPARKMMRLNNPKVASNKHVQVKSTSQSKANFVRQSAKGGCTMLISLVSHHKMLLILLKNHHLLLKVGIHNFASKIGGGNHYLIYIIPIL